MLMSFSLWPDTIPVIELEFQEDQWEYACEHYRQDIYVPALLTCGEYSFDCTFRIRGATSREYPKKSIKIELPGGIHLFGMDELNLNAEYLDETRLRELLSYLYYAETGQIVPEVHLTEVVFNGETQGPFVSVQDVDEDFLLNTPLPDEAVIYKCSDRYTTLDRPLELEPYRKKTFENHPWDDLELLIHWLLLCPDESFREYLPGRFHYEDLISCVASNVLLGHGSTYYHNYLLLLDETGAEGKWRYITWDMDRTWGKYGPEFPYWKNSSNGGNRRNTLVWRMWCNTLIREELILEIEEQYPLIRAFALSGKVDSLALAVAPLVESDPFRSCTMEEFWAAVEALKAWPGARYGNLQNQLSNWPLPFRIFSPVSEGSNLLISWTGGGTNCSWRVEVSPDSLFSHGEDVVYEAFTLDTFHILPERFAENGLWLQVYGTRNGVEHRASNGPVAPLAPASYPFTGQLVVSEINYMSSPAFNPGDWFEAVNTGDAPVALSGWSLRDANPQNLTTINGIVVQPGECLVFASDSFLFSGAFPGLPQASYTLNFALSNSGDDVVLRDPTGFTVDIVSFSPAPAWPDAAGNGSTLILQNLSADNGNPISWVSGPFGGTPFSTGTWDQNWPENGAVSMRVLGPVPSAENISFILTAIAPAAAEFTLFDLSGRAVTETIELDLEQGEHSLTVPAADLPSGVYFAMLKNMGFTESLKITVIGDQ